MRNPDTGHKAGLRAFDRACEAQVPADLPDMRNKFNVIDEV